MKIAVVGSRSLFVNLEFPIPPGVTEIVSGGAKGIDQCAEIYAKKHHLKLTVFLPDYFQYGRAAPLKRNEQIVNYADCILAFWNGKSRGTKHTVNYARKKGKPTEVILLNQ